MQLSNDTWKKSTRPPLPRKKGTVPKESGRVLSGNLGPKYRSPYCSTVCCSIESALKKVSAKGRVGNWFLVRCTLSWIVCTDNALLRYLHFYSFDVLIVPFPKDFVSPAQKTTTLKWCTTIVWELARVTRKGPLYRQLLWLSVNHRGLKFEIKSSFYWNLEHKGGPASENCCVVYLNEVLIFRKGAFPELFLWWTQTRFSHFIILSSPLFPFCIFILCFQCERFRLCAFQGGKVFSQTLLPPFVEISGVKMEKGERQLKL